MDQLAAMRIFVAVGDAQGFAAAARRLRISPPAVTRAVAALEEHLGARLLHRTTRTVRPTEAGARYLADCRRILAELGDADAAAAGAHAEPRGTLAVTAPLQFGRLHVAPVLLELAERHPAISVRALFLDRVVDLIEEGLDVAVRIGPLPDSGLTAVRVGEVRRVLCASPRYLRRRGRPRSPAELAAHDAIVFSAVPAVASWTFRDGTAVQPSPRMSFNTADVVVAAAVAGHGIARLLAYQVEAELAAGTLEIILADHEPPPVPIHIVHAEGRRASARVQAFVALARERLLERSARIAAGAAAGRRRAARRSAGRRVGTRGDE